MKRTTMRDVAEKAGVSKATVSHVINETRFVEEVTKQRVQNAIKELGYRPSFAARSLTTQSSHIVGSIVSDVTNNFFAQIIRGIEDVLYSHNYSLMVCNTNEVLEREEYYIDILLRQGVDGIIAAATSQNWEVLNEASKLNVPIILLDRIFENATSSYVGVGNEQGAYLGTKHLIERGHRDIGILSGFHRLSTMRERLSGFQQAMHENGLIIREEWSLSTPLSIEDGKQAIQALMQLEAPPSAVFICNNLLSLGALIGLQEMGLSCPDDVAIIGFDDHPWAAVSSPPLTVIRQPTYAIGKTAAQMLLEAINSSNSDITSTVFDCELVIRGST